jgi:hypothetical protein
MYYPNLYVLQVHALGDECWIGVTYDKPAIADMNSTTSTMNPHSFPAGHTWGLYGGRRSMPVYKAGDIVGVLVNASDHRCLFYVNGLLRAFAECSLSHGRERTQEVEEVGEEAEQVENDLSQRQPQRQPFLFITLDSKGDDLALLDPDAHPLTGDMQPPPCARHFVPSSTPFTPLIYVYASRYTCLRVVP